MTRTQSLSASQPERCAHWYTQKEWKHARFQIWNFEGALGCLCPCSLSLDSCILHRTLLCILQGSDPCHLHDTFLFPGRNGNFLLCVCPKVYAVLSSTSLTKDANYPLNYFPELPSSPCVQPGTAESLVSVCQKNECQQGLWLPKAVIPLVILTSLKMYQTPLVPCLICSLFWRLWHMSITW